MTDWAGVRQELQDAGYPGFEFKRGETPVPGLSGEWVAAAVIFVLSYKWIARIGVVLHDREVLFDGVVGR